MDAGGLAWDAATRATDEAVAQWPDGEPGGVVALFDCDGVRTARCGGLSSLEHAVPFGLDTPTRYASISKQFLCALLAGGASVGFEDRLGTHLDLAPALASIPVDRALDMTAGLSDAMETLWLLGVPPTAASGREALRRFASRLDATNFPPGSEISYSNTGYRLVQEALSAANEDYGALLHERLFAPLDLGIVLPDDDATPVRDLATGYWRDEAGWHRGRYGPHISASGGLAGSASDLVRWGGALLANRGPATGLLARLSAERTLADGTPTGYGLGLAWQAVGTCRWVGHGGSLPGYKNHMLLDPDTGSGVVVLSNREETDALGIALAIMAALHRASLPHAAASLPNGMFVAECGPFWLELKAGVATFLGAGEKLFADGTGDAVSRSAHLPMRLRCAADGIAGEMGHVARTFRPVPPDAACDPAWSGVWQEAQENARLEVDGDTVRVGTGSLLEEVRLRPLGGGRALAQRAGAPWSLRFCLDFSGDGLRLVSNRSRVLRYRK